MTTEGNGSTSPIRNLPATPEPGPLPRPRPLAPDTRTPSPDAPGQPGLADHDRRKRWERLMRRLLADADHWMQAGSSIPTVVSARWRRRRPTRTSSGSRSATRRPWDPVSIAACRRWQRWIPKFVLSFDFALLLYFFAGITNVDWQSPLSMNLAFATALAAMVTVLAYGFLAFTGHRMRCYKNHAGTLHLDELDGFTKAAFGTAMTVITVLAALMYLRIRSEVIGALGSQAGVTALVIPLAVAVVSAVANFLVVLIHALDGSDEVARLNKLAAATRRPARKAHRLRRRAAQQADR